ncbi:MAG: rRNA maturation RNase YbeY [Clostridiales bacterium]|jgi:probable rRNA maturation factor|nr:rRNA maturation RNase YbeY [Clostridiales bacterium]
MKILWDDRGAEAVPKSYYVTMKQAALAALRKCFEVEDLKALNYEVSISFVSDEEIRELNNKYREQDKPTDVLSFPTMEAPPGKIFPMGDIVISTETAARQAQEYGHTYERELTFLTVHGMLHLLGLDHEASLEDEKIMEEITDEIIKSLKL